MKVGAPKEIHVDCGKVFESKVMKEFAKSMGITLCFSSPYHHNTNGVIERQFRTIRDFLNASIKEKKQKDWAEMIPDIEFTMNATFQKSIGRSPAEVIYGRKICRERWYSSRQTPQKEDTGSPNERYHTRRSFNIGDDVLVEVESKTKGKDRYEGPYKVARKIHDLRYQLQRADGRVIERNVEKLRTFLKEGGCEE